MVESSGGLNSGIGKLWSLWTIQVVFSEGRNVWVSRLGLITVGDPWVPLVFAAGLAEVVVLSLLFVLPDLGSCLSDPQFSHL